MRYEGYPDAGELVVGKVEEIEDFGVFVDLEAYDDKEGLVHVSEVASGWIKNVRDHVNTGQTVVAKVLSVDEDAQQIDLSLKDVNDHQRKETIQQWKSEQKADNWLERAVDDGEFRRVAEALLGEFDSLYAAFEAAAIRGEDALEAVDLDAEAADAVIETARENVSVPYVEVSGYVTLECTDPDGVDTVKRALEAAEADGNGDVPDEVDLEVTYIGAPEYRISVRAPSYKTAEDALEASAERATGVIEDDGGFAEFHRERREAEA